MRKGFIFEVFFIFIYLFQNQVKMVDMIIHAKGSNISRQHMCLPVEWNSEEEGSHGRRRRERSEGGPLIYGVWPFSGFVSVQEVRASERARPIMREMFFLFMRERGTTEGSWRTQTSNTHQSTIYKMPQNKQEITSKSLNFTWKTPGCKQDMRSGP
jgi:hypothetical protein